MKTAGAVHRADKQKAENVFPAGKLPFRVVIYILNDPVFQRRNNTHFQMFCLEGNQICLHLSRHRILNFKMQMFPQHKAYEMLGVGLSFVLETRHSESLRKIVTD